jgi:DNA-directed RNA polymerase II subunit RPB1
MDDIIQIYNRSIVQPGDMIGILSAQALGETITQMTLNAFHSAGLSTMKVLTTGVPRIQEILSVSKKNKRFYFETFFSYTSWHTKQELTYLENDTLQCVITEDGNNTVIYTRFDFNTYNPPFLVIYEEN